jgi:hypothetical protein
MISKEKGQRAIYKKYFNTWVAVGKHHGFADVETHFISSLNHAEGSGSMASLGQRAAQHLTSRLGLNYGYITQSHMCIIA